MAEAEASQHQQHQQHPHGHNRPAPLGPFNSDRKHSEPERWICIYPAYMNKNKTRKEGRIVSKEKAVPNPTYLEIRDVLMAADYQPLIENKQYPRERSRELDFRGRIRVPLRKDDGSLHDENFPSRESIMLHVCDKIPQLKSRVNASKQSADATNQQSSGGSRKGGKKKNRN